MEAPGFLTVLYIMFTLPDKLGITLERDAWIMAGLYVCYSCLVSTAVTESRSVYIMYIAQSYRLY